MRFIVDSRPGHERIPLAGALLVLACLLCLVACGDAFTASTDPLVAVSGSGGLAETLPQAAAGGRADPGPQGGAGAHAAGGSTSSAAGAGGGAAGGASAGAASAVAGAGGSIGSAGGAIGGAGAGAGGLSRNANGGLLCLEGWRTKSCAAVNDCINDQEHNCASAVDCCKSGPPAGYALCTLSSDIGCGTSSGPSLAVVDCLCGGAQ